MTDHDVILRAILDDPADDLPRLAYADWCEENGQVDRAEFIRVEMHISRICRSNRKGTPEPDANRLDEMISRQSALMYGVWELGWLDPLPRELISGSVHNRGFVAEVRCPLQMWLAHGPAIIRSHPVESVVATDRVAERLTNGGAAWGSPQIGCIHSYATLPEEIYALLPGETVHGFQNVSFGTWGKRFASPTEADNALSAALLVHAKQAAITSPR